mgnify:CR=1 FL=1
MEFNLDFNMDKADITQNPKIKINKADWDYKEIQAIQKLFKSKKYCITLGFESYYRLIGLKKDLNTNLNKVIFIQASHPFKLNLKERIRGDRKKCTILLDANSLCYIKNGYIASPFHDKGESKSIDLEKWGNYSLSTKIESIINNFYEGMVEKNANI